MDELTTTEASEKLGCEPQTIRNYFKRGKLDGRRVGGSGSNIRVYKISVDDFLAKHGRLDRKHRVRDAPKPKPRVEPVHDADRDRDQLRARIALLENTIAQLRNAADANRMIEAERTVKIDHLLAALAADERIEELRRRAAGGLEDALAAVIVPATPPS